MTSWLGPAERQAALDAAPRDELDVVVIGGGVVGAGAALDAVTRGLSVALFEVRVPAAVCWDTTQMRASRGNTGRARAQLSRAASRASATDALGLDSAGTCTTRWSVAVRCSGGRSGGNMAP